MLKRCRDVSSVEMLVHGVVVFANGVESYSTMAFARKSTKCGNKGKHEFLRQSCVWTNKMIEDMNGLILTIQGGGPGGRRTNYI